MKSGDFRGNIKWQISNDKWEMELFGLTNIDRDHVGGASIDYQPHFHLAAPSQAAWQAQIDLIKPIKAPLRSRIRYLRVNSTYRGSQ